jgi:hypothetical protein
VVLDDDQAEAIGQPLVGELDDGYGHARSILADAKVGMALYG